MTGRHRKDAVLEFSTAKRNKTRLPLSKETSSETEQPVGKKHGFCQIKIQ